MASDALPIDIAKHELTQQKRQRPSTDKASAPVRELEANAESSTINGVRGTSHGRMILRPGDKYKTHPVAHAFPREPQHLARLRASIEKVGQQTPVRYRILSDGSIEIEAGLSRIHVLYSMGKDVECKELTDLELGGRSLAEWICAENFGNEGRMQDETQRSLQVVSLKDVVEKLQEQAKNRRVGGKACDGKVKARVSEELAKLANVTPNRIDDAFELLEAEDDVLRQLVWDGIVSMNKALQITRIPDAEKRRRATAIAGDKTKKGELADLLSKASQRRDPFAGTVLPSLRVPSENARIISSAIEHIDIALKTLAAVDGLEPRFAEDLVRTRDSLDGVRPYELCTECKACGWSDPANGVKCQNCGAKGWLTLEEFNSAAFDREAALPKAR